MFVIFTVILVFAVLLALRGTEHNSHHALAISTNFHLAGTLIIDHRRWTGDYLDVVEVSPRDILFGLARALPGPNFNSALYLGSLALAGRQHSVTTFRGFFWKPLASFR